MSREREVVHTYLGGESFLSLVVPPFEAELFLLEFICGSEVNEISAKKFPLQIHPPRPTNELKSSPLPNILRDLRSQFLVSWAVIFPGRGDSRIASKVDTEIHLYV